MKASIIIIGDEILLGQVIDTNSGEIARMLSPEGWQVLSTRVVGDDAACIRQAVEQALGEADLVITTGGLGPTKDDITKTVLLGIFGGTLQRDPSVEDNIREVFGKRGLQLNRSTLDQALVPTSCRVIQNELGTAPIMWFERDGRVLVSMPGVPFETVGMMQRSVLGLIKERFNPRDVLLHHTLMVSGITESDLSERLSGYESVLPDGMHLAYLPAAGVIRLRLDGKNVDPLAFDQHVSWLKAEVGEYLIHDGDTTLAEVLLERLRRHRMTVSTAESCTGGNIARSITQVPGSSDCFMGAVVSYSNSVKAGVLGVTQVDLEFNGAVSEPVVRSMALGATHVIGTHCSMATSGIAGPGGGTPDKPVGTVWMAVCVGGRVVTRCRRFPGSRSRVIERATTEVMLMLIHALDDMVKKPKK